MSSKQKHDPNVSRQELLEHYQKTQSIIFFARRFNFVEYRTVLIPGINEQIPLEVLLNHIGITPQQLRPIFNPILKWVLLDKKIIYLPVELPENINRFENLGGFPLLESRFQLLSRLLGKTLCIYREQDCTQYEIFTVHPDTDKVTHTSNFETEFHQPSNH